MNWLRWWPRKKKIEPAPPKIDVFEVVDRGHAKPRFLVVRTLDGTDHYAYMGNDGRDAANAWALYQSGTLNGNFRFYDRQHPGQLRAHFVRA